MSIVEIKNLTKYYGGVRGIEDVTLNIEEGEIFGFIGPNGAGKSTTIRTILSLIHKTSGEARIFGLDCEKDRVEILKDVGYLPSEVFYYDNMKVADLLKYSASFYKKDCTKRIAELSSALDLDLNRKIDDLSFGNKKKIGIVQGLLHEPKLIILDEPTGGLDPLMQKTFFELIRKENEKGATVLFSSHILSEVQKICDRVAIIKEGGIIKVEKISEMTANSYKHFIIEIKGGERPDYSKKKGVSGFNVSGGSISFVYYGEINEILRDIVKYDIANIQIVEPDLEEIFMHFYEK